MFVLVAFLVALSASAEPELKLLRPDGVAHPQEPYNFVCQVSWSGDAGQYVVLPVKIESVDWGDVNLQKAETVVLNGICTVSQTVSITPARAGSFEVPEILIALRNPEDLTPPETSAPATDPTGLASVDPTLPGTPFILHVKPDRTPAWVSGGLGALLLCLMLGWWFARKRRPPAGHVPPSEAAPHAEWNEHLLDAKRRRLDNQPYEFYLALTRALELCPEEAQLSSRMKSRAQEVGYQGVRPTEEQLSSDYEAVRTALARQPGE